MDAINLSATLTGHSLANPIYLNFIHACMPKTITISDDVYRELKRLKGDKSFSDVIRSLLRKKGNVEVLRIAFGTRSKEEADELKDEMKEVEEWMRSLIPA